MSDDVRIFDVFDLLGQRREFVEMGSKQTQSPNLFGNVSERR